MAIQKGIVKLSGKLGNLIFYSRNQEVLVRTAANNYQLSEGSKQSAKDFGEASKNAAYIRKVLAPVITKYGNSNLVNRMNKVFMQIFNTIPKSLRGNKSLVDGDLSLLKGFEFNSFASFNQFIFFTPQVQLDRTAQLNIDLKAGEVEQIFSLKVPNASTIGLDVLILNFDLGRDKYQIYQSQTLKIDLCTPFKGAKMQIDIQQKGECCLLVVMGVHYYTERIQIENRKYFAAQIVESWRMRDGLIIPFVGTNQKSIEPNLLNDNEGLSWELGI